MSSDLIQVGRVAGAFGVRGEVRITSYTAQPLALVDYKTLVREDGSTGLTLLSGRPAKAGIVARAKEIETREQAEALRGLKLFIPRSVLPDPEEDAAIGSVKSVQDFGAGDLLEIAPAEGGATWYLPFTREAVPEVRIADGVVVAVRPEEVE